MAINLKSSVPPWLSIARKEQGVLEEAGIVNNPRILEYHKSTKLRATTDEIPWCSSFACWCMEKAGIPSPKSARAKDWLDWGVPVEKPTLGCIVVIRRAINKGHVGFYESEDSYSIALTGGNQRDSVCILLYPKTRVLGYRMPDKLWWPQTLDDGSNPPDLPA